MCFGLCEQVEPLEIFGNVWMCEIGFQWDALLCHCWRDFPVLILKYSYCFSQAAIKLIFRDALFSETSSRTDAHGFNRRIKESHETCQYVQSDERSKKLRLCKITCRTFLGFFFVWFFCFVFVWVKCNKSFKNPLKNFFYIKNIFFLLFFKYFVVKYLWLTFVITFVIIFNNKIKRNKKKCFI